MKTKSPSNDRHKICPECKQDFTCSISNCWCAELPPFMELIENAECFCPACLKEKLKVARLNK
jgi:hypothetical protein